MYIFIIDKVPVKSVGIISEIQGQANECTRNGCVLDGVCNQTWECDQYCISSSRFRLLPILFVRRFRSRNFHFIIFILLNYPNEKINTLKLNYITIVLISKFIPKTTYTC